VSLYRIEPLQASHAVEGLNCGDEDLNRFLIRFALANQRARASRTCVALVGDAVVGFHLQIHEWIPFGDSCSYRKRKPFGLAHSVLPQAEFLRASASVLPPA
jgi:hypothetical protein